ncbi:hypothetical protein StoSoilB3_18720 [Arthrobacter sp. StoSoilB3]|nr:hypothetical protein StoSoilB3_18720 [Arthrobacter sp. StoSoilB3]
MAPGVHDDALLKSKHLGKREDRPQLAACLKALGKGDVLGAWKLDLLVRDTPHVVNVVHDLTHGNWA